MRKSITYAIDRDGIVYSRYKDKIAFPVLQYQNMSAANNFATSYKLESASIFDLSCYWDNLKWTKKIPINIKNEHRKFWELPLLK